MGSCYGCTSHRKSATSQLSRRDRDFLKYLDSQRSRRAKDHHPEETTENPQATAGDRSTQPGVSQALPEQVAAGQKMRALLVGFDYRHTSFYLRGAIKDVQVVQKALLDHYSMPPENISIVKDQPTNSFLSRGFPRARMIKGLLTKLCKDTKSGDSLIFYFAGYATQGFNLKDGTHHGLCYEAMVAADGNLIFGSDIREILFHNLIPGAKFTMITDCCVSSNFLYSRAEEHEEKNEVIGRFLPMSSVMKIPASRASMYSDLSGKAAPCYQFDANGDPEEVSRHMFHHFETDAPQLCLELLNAPEARRQVHQKFDYVTGSPKDTLVIHLTACLISEPCLEQYSSYGGGLLASMLAKNFFFRGPEIVQADDCQIPLKKRLTNTEAVSDEHRSMERTPNPSSQQLSNKRRNF